MGEGGNEFKFFPLLFFCIPCWALKEQPWTNVPQLAFFNKSIFTIRPLSQPLSRQALTCISVFFFGGEMAPEQHYFQNFFSSKSLHIDYRFGMLPKIQWGTKNFLLSSLTYSQLWLSPLVDDCPLDLPLTKLQNKNPGYQ